MPGDKVRRLGSKPVIVTVELPGRRIEIATAAGAGTGRSDAAKAGDPGRRQACGHATR